MLFSSFHWVPLVMYVSHLLQIFKLALAKPAFALSVLVPASSRTCFFTWEKCGDVNKVGAISANVQ